MKVNALPSLLPFVQRICIFFFFQAEDGIRDLIVTGVQTCALPIDRKSTRLTPVTIRSRMPSSACDWSQTCALPIDRKSTRLNSSHDQISYAVFCLKKKKNTDTLHDSRGSCTSCSMKPTSSAPSTQSRSAAPLAANRGYALANLHQRGTSVPARNTL